MKTAFAAILMVIFSISIIAYSNSYQMEEAQLGKDAPDFTLIGLDGNKVTLFDLEGIEPVVLIFGSCT